MLKLWKAVAGALVSVWFLGVVLGLSLFLSLFLILFPGGLP